MRLPRSRDAARLRGVRWSGLARPPRAGVRGRVRRHRRPRRSRAAARFGGGVDRGGGCGGPLRRRLPGRAGGGRRWARPRGQGPGGAPCRVAARTRHRPHRRRSGRDRPARDAPGNGDRRPRGSAARNRPSHRRRTSSRDARVVRSARARPGARPDERRPAVPPQPGAPRGAALARRRRRSRRRAAAVPAGRPRHRRGRRARRARPRGHPRPHRRHAPWPRPRLRSLAGRCGPGCAPRPTTSTTHPTRPPSIGSSPSPSARPSAPSYRAGSACAGAVSGSESSAPRSDR